MKAVVGIAERRDDGALWKSCKRAYYNETKNDKGDEKTYEFVVYGNEQFSEYELLIRTCKFLVHKLLKIKKMISDRNNKEEFPKEKTIKFVFENEDHTLGEPVNYELQDHKDIIFSGFSKADHLIKTGVITATSTKETPVNALLDSIETVSEKINKIGYLLMNLAGKKENKEENNKNEKTEKSDKKKKK
jgi:DNA-directed RNA polymerase subunit L